MLNIILCDDNPQALGVYEDMLKKTSVTNHIDTKITLFESGEQLLFNLSDAPNSADIIYLDILMGPTNGIEIARKLRELGFVSILIFLTSSNEYVFESFDSTPYYYIVKDETSEKKFNDIFLKAADSVKLKRTNYIVISIGNTNIKLSIDKIKYFEVRNRIITVHTVNDDFDYYARLDDLEVQMSDRGFARIHRSYLINCYYIHKLSRTQVVLTDGTELPVSAKYTDSVKDAFSNYLISV